MGVCGSKDSADKKKNADINKALRGDKQKLDSEVKLLLLGAGESGKSTIAKQMRIIHMDGFSKDERMSFKSIIYSNVLGSMRNILNAAKKFSIEIGADAKEAADRMLSEEQEFFSGPITPGMGEDIKKLWADSGVQDAYKRRAEYQLFDSAGYYFEEIDRIASADYEPTEQDVLRSRAKTTGIIETEFDIGGAHFRLCDVGGQRSERKKWMHCFQEVTACIFCVSLSAYDQKLYEDDQTIRMHESLKLFKEICNSKWFVDTAMILFLNKKDLFMEKIKTVDLNVCFADYTGGCDYEAALSFITERFVAQNENPKKPIYSHVTCATDTDNVKVVFGAVQDIVLRKALDSSEMF